MPKYVERRKKSDPLENLVDHIALYYRQKKIDEDKNKRYVQSGIISNLVDVRDVTSADQISNRISMLQGMQGTVDESLVDLVGASIQTLQGQHGIFQKREGILDRASQTMDALSTIREPMLTSNTKPGDIQESATILNDILSNRVEDLAALDRSQRADYRQYLKYFEKESSVLDFLLQGDDPETEDVFEIQPPTGYDNTPVAQRLMDDISVNYAIGDVDAALESIQQLQKANVIDLKKQSSDFLEESKTATEEASSALQTDLNKNAQLLKDLGGTIGERGRNKIDKYAFRIAKDHALNVITKVDEANQIIPPESAERQFQDGSMAIRKLAIAEHGSSEGASPVYNFLVDAAGGSSAVDSHSAKMGEKFTEKNPHFNALFAYTMLHNQANLEASDFGSKSAGIWFVDHLVTTLSLYKYRYGEDSLEKVKEIYDKIKEDRLTPIDKGLGISLAPGTDKASTLQWLMNNWDESGIKEEESDKGYQGLIQP